MPEKQPRVAMITGGNSGIGFATAGKLAAKGFHVILASRNQQTSAQAIERICAGNPSASVESIPLDLASFAAVRQCAAAFQAKGHPLHVLINNAGGSVAGERASFTPPAFPRPPGFTWALATTTSVPAAAAPMASRVAWPRRVVSASVTSWSALSALRITTRARAVTDDADELTSSSTFTTRPTLGEPDAAVPPQDLSPHGLSADNRAHERRCLREADP